MTLALALEPDEEGEVVATMDGSTNDSPPAAPFLRARVVDQFLQARSSPCCSRSYR